MNRHAWFPTSPCGPGCRTGGEPRVGLVRAATRLAATALVLVASLPVVLLGRAVFVRAVFRLVLLALGVRLVVTGADRLAGRGRGGLVVTNHVSWLDPVALGAVRPMRALAKKDIRAWPVLGGLIAAAGTVFVDRERLRRLPGTVRELATVLRGGALVAVCAEGTTWCGSDLGRFAPAPFQAAIDGGVPVIPVALRYRIAGGPVTPAPAFLGDETIVESIRRVVRLRGLVVDVVILDELAPGRAPDRRTLAALTRASLACELGHSGRYVREPGRIAPREAAFQRPK